MIENTSSAQSDSLIPDDNRKQTRKSLGLFAVITVSLLCNIVVTGAALWYYDTHYAIKLKLMTADVRGYSNDLEGKLIKGNINNNDVTLFFTEWKKKIMREASGSNTIVLLKEVVVYGDLPEIKPGS